MHIRIDENVLQSILLKVQAEYGFTFSALVFGGEIILIGEPDGKTVQIQNRLSELIFETQIVRGHA